MLDTVQGQPKSITFTMDSCDYNIRMVDVVLSLKDFATSSPCVSVVVQNHSGALDLEGLERCRPEVTDLRLVNVALDTSYHPSSLKAVTQFTMQGCSFVGPKQIFHAWNQYCKLNIIECKGFTGQESGIKRLQGLSTLELDLYEPPVDTVCRILKAVGTSATSLTVRIHSKDADVSNILRSTGYTVSRDGDHLLITSGTSVDSTKIHVASLVNDENQNPLSGSIVGYQDADWG